MKYIFKGFLIIVFATAFWACEKVEKMYTEIRIVSASITEIDAKSADFTVVLNDDVRFLEDMGVLLWGTADTSDAIGLWDYMGWNENGNSYEYVYKMQIVGLESGTTYQCQAYIAAGDITKYSELVTFTTK
jgi:hypothetical protein